MSDVGKERVDGALRYRPLSKSGLRFLAVASILQSVNESAWIRASAGHTAPWSLNVALTRLPISFERLYPVCDWREWNERGMNLVDVTLFLCVAHRGRRTP